MLLPAFELIEQSLHLFRSNARRFAPLMAASAGALFLRTLMEKATLSFLPEANRVVVFTLIALLFLLVGLVLQGAFVDLTARAALGKEGSARLSALAGMHYLLPLAWVAALQFVLFAAGLVALVVPLLLFTVWYAFPAYHVVVDDQRGSAAFKASKRLVSGRWWAVLWRLFLPTLFFILAFILLTNAMSYGLGVLFGNPGLFFAYVDVGVIPTSQLAIFSALQAALASLAIPLFTSAKTLLWLDLKRTTSPEA